MDTLDLSEIGPKRRKVKLPDGELYEIMGPADINPVLITKFGLLCQQAEALKKPDSIAEAEKLDKVVRQQALLACPFMPDDLAKSLTYQVAMGIIGFFLQDAAEIIASQGMVPEIQEVFDRITLVE